MWIRGIKGYGTPKKSCQDFGTDGWRIPLGIIERTGSPSVPKTHRCPILFNFTGLHQKRVYTCWGTSGLQGVYHYNYFLLMCTPLSGVSQWFNDLFGRVHELLLLASCTATANILKVIPLAKILLITYRWPLTSMFWVFRPWWHLPILMLIPSDCKNNVDKSSRQVW